MYTSINYHFLRNTLVSLYLYIKDSMSYKKGIYSKALM